MAIAEYLTDSDFAEGSEAYIQYCSGLAIVQYPHDMIPVHNRTEVEENVDEILATAESIMLSGLRRLMYVSQPLNDRGEHRALSASKAEFKEVEPAMREILEYACERHETRIGKLNEYYAILRPAPILDKAVYGKIASGRSQRLTLSELLSGFVPHVDLIEAVREYDAAVSTLRHESAEPEQIDTGRLRQPKQDL